MGSGDGVHFFQALPLRKRLASARPAHVADDDRDDRSQQMDGQIVAHTVEDQELGAWVVIVAGERSPARSTIRLPCQAVLLGDQRAQAVDHRR